MTHDGAKVPHPWSSINGRSCDDGKVIQIRIDPIARLGFQFRHDDQWPDGVCNIWKQIPIVMRSCVFGSERRVQ